MILHRLKIKKRQNGQPVKFSSGKSIAAKRASIPLRVSLNSQFSLMYANLKKISLQKGSYIAAFQEEQKKIQYNISKLATVFKRVFTSVLIVMVVLSQTVLVQGFEAHVINITAKICSYSQTRSIGYWKTHFEIYKHLLPQALGTESVSTASEVDDILGFSGDASIMRNKLKAQLLGLKFNIYFYHIGGYFVDSEGQTLYEIAAEADALLEDSGATKSELEKMKDLLDDTNNLGSIKSCPTGIVINEFLANAIGNDADRKKNGEWIELYNLGDKEVDVGSWAFYDLHDENELLITELNTDTGSTIIKPKDFLVVYRNGNKNFNLNNTFGDSIRLYDKSIGNKRTLIDIYAYTVDSPEGKSFALVPDGSTNWVDPSPTPGEPNSLEGENLEFGQAQLEPGEDTEVINTDMEVPEKVPQDLGTSSLDNLDSASLAPETTPEIAAGFAEPTPTAEPSNGVANNAVNNASGSSAPNELANPRQDVLENHPENNAGSQQAVDNSASPGIASGGNSSTGSDPISPPLSTPELAPALVGPVLTPDLPPVLTSDPTLIPEDLTPVPEPTPSLKPTPIPESVPVSDPIPSLEPTPAPTPTLTPTPTQTSTSIPTLTPTLTPAPTPIIVPELTASPEPELVPESSPISEPTPSLEPSPEPEVTPMPAITPSIELIPEPISIPVLELTPTPTPVLESVISPSIESSPAISPEPDPASVANGVSVNNISSDPSSETSET